MRKLENLLTATQGAFDQQPHTDSQPTFMEPGEEGADQGLHPSRRPPFSL